MRRVVFLGLLLAAFVAVAVRTGVSGQSPPAYRVHHPDSYVVAITGKSGLFSFVAGHRHAVLATGWSAKLDVDPADPARSTATITVPVSSLVIDSAEALKRAGLGSGPSSKDIRTIQERMLSSEILDVERHSEIQFTTTGIERAGEDQLTVSGTFQMHGHAEPVTFPVRFRRHESGGFGFSGEFKIRQTAFGIQPESVAGGTVRVDDEVTIRFQVSIVQAGDAM